MTSILMTDNLTGETQKNELKWKKDIPEEIEIEMFKREFAENLVAEEWSKAGLVEINSADEIVFNEFSPRDMMRFQAECIEREKNITVEVLDCDRPTENIKSIRLKNKRTGIVCTIKNKWSPINTIESLIILAKTDIAMAEVFLKWAEDGRISDLEQELAAILQKMETEYPGEFKKEYVKARKNWEVVSFEE